MRKRVTMLYHAVTFAITLALLQFIWLQPPSTSKTRLKNKDVAFTARDFEYGVIKILLLPSTPTSNTRRRYVIFARKRRYFSARIKYTSKSISTYQQERLMISGDVERNPGPYSDKRNRKTCSICSRTIASNHRHVECSTCKTTCHIKCCGVSVDYYRALHSSVILSWKCIASKCEGCRCRDFNPTVSNASSTRYIRRDHC